MDANAVLDILAVRDHTVVLLTARHAVAPERLQALRLRPLGQVDAVGLLEQRLHQADMERPNTEDKLHLRSLADAVDGLPLAIELTAAYAGKQHLGLDTVLEETRYGLASGPFKDLNDPNRGLLVTFESSWRVLTATQQQLFAGLSLLEGVSFPRATADALAKAASERRPHRAINAPREAMLRRHPGQLASKTTMGPLNRGRRIFGDYALVEPLANGRLRLHPLLREYAADRLKELGDDVQQRLGHAMMRYWLDFANKHVGQEDMDALEAEAEGLMGALEWAGQNEYWSEVLEFAHSILIAWLVHDRNEEALRVCTWAEQAAVNLGDLHEQRWAAHRKGVIRTTLGSLNTARLDFSRALKLAQQSGDRNTMRAEVHGLAELDARSGRVREAREGYQRALKLAQQSGNSEAILTEIHALAVLDAQVGRIGAAIQGFLRARKLAERLKDHRAVFFETLALADVLPEIWREDAARDYYSQAFDLARKYGDQIMLAIVQRHLGLFLWKQSQVEQGRKMIEASLAISESLGRDRDIGHCHQFLAWIEGDAGNRDAAIMHYREALRCFEQVQAPEAETVRRSLHVLGLDT